MWTYTTKYRTERVARGIYRVYLFSMSSRGFIHTATVRAGSPRAAHLAALEMPEAASSDFDR